MPVTSFWTSSIRIIKQFNFTKLKYLVIVYLVVNSFSGLCQPTTHAKPRAIVTTDGEIDDVDSFIRMLLYANEFDLEGLIYSSSMWHYQGDGKGTKIISEMEMTKKMYGERTDLRWAGTQWMQDLIGAYEKVYPKLSTHAKDFPTASLQPYGIKAQHPDGFIIQLMEIDMENVCTAARQHRINLKNPPKTALEYLGTLERQGLPQTVARLREFVSII